MAGTPGFEPGPVNSGPTLAIQHNTTNALALLVAAPRGTERLLMVRQNARDAHTRLIPFDETREAVTEMHQRKNRLQWLTGHRNEGGFELGDTDARVIEASARLEEAEREVKRLQRLDAERSPVYATASRLAARAEREISDRPAGTTWRDAEEPAIPKGDLGEAIQRQREAIRAKQAEIARIAKAPVTREVAKQHARDQLAAMARPPDLSGLKFGRDIVFPIERLQVEVHNSGGGTVGFAATNDGSGLVAWLFRDQLLQRIDAEVDKVIGAKEGMTPDERQVVVARLEGELMDLERLDVALTWAAIAQGLAITHREDVSIAALIGVRLVTQPVQSSQSSPGHAFDLVGAGRG
jgi:hypothetical protein